MWVSDDVTTPLDNLPLRMKGLQQWLVWRFETFAGDKKPRKVPYYVGGPKRTGTQGSQADRAALASFDRAVQDMQRRKFDGIGFAFLPGDGLVGIDIDKAIDLETGEVSPMCREVIDACASYTELSPSGKGVHIICEGKTETFKSNEIGLEVFCGRQFFTCTGQRWAQTHEDVQPVSEETLEHLRTMVRGARAQAPTPSAPGAAHRPGSTPTTAGDLARKLESALPYIDADMGHDDWVRVGMALKAALGESGFSLWSHWSSKGSKFPGDEVLQRKWKSFSGTGVTEGTVFKWAMDGGWRPPRAQAPASAPKPAGRAPAPAEDTGPGVTDHEGYGGHEHDAADHADAPPPVEPDDGASTPSAGSAAVGAKRKRPNLPPALDAMLLRAPRGGIADCRENVYLVLKHHAELAGLIGYDEFAHRTLKLRQPPWDSPVGEWSTNDDYFLGYWLATHLRIEIRSEATIVAGVAMAAYENRFHPVREYLESLPAWDGIERLPHWLHECLGAEDNTYTRLVGTWFPMNMVRRIRQPGCQADYMVVLEGLQGKRKSTSLRTLVGRDEWFADTPIRIGDKDALLNLSGKWLYEIGELDSFNRAETTAVKQYLTSRIDRVREPFARRPADRERSCIFAGTTNQGEYFKDPTGARRFWPVACDGEINLEKLAAWREQLFAEAMVRLASDDPEMRRCWPTREEEQKYLVPEQEKREIGDPWFERVAGWINSAAKFGDGIHEVREVMSFTTHDLLTSCLGVPSDRIDGSRQMSTRVGIIMHKLGWAKRRDAHGARLWRYVRPTLKDEKAQEAQNASTDGAMGGPVRQPQAGGPAREEIDEF